MFIGCLQVELLIPESASLKSKRMVLNSVKQRLRNKFNVSVAEVDNNDLWQRTTLAVAMVANKRQFLNQALDQILNFIDDQSQSEIIDHQIEIF